MASEGALREIVESVVIAFVLAFLFRTFEAEAFVIPTGSMAPTLMGRHKDLTCQKCGYPYQVSASAEVDPRSGARLNYDVMSGTCPLCRYTMDVSPRNPQGKDYPSYAGDRIIVGKFPYQFGVPQRWDVAVFRYPGEAKTNYIKRVVGLPGETIRIRHGDLWVKQAGEPDFVLAQKPPKKVRAMLQPVYDNDYLIPAILKQGWPARWSSEQREGWTSDEQRQFHADGTAAGDVWLRYRHFVPSATDWASLSNGGVPVPGSVHPQLITDFTAYNAGGEPNSPSVTPYGGPAAPRPHSLGLHWVGDLALECVLTAESQSGSVILELVKGGQRFQCTFDLATGGATLGILGRPEFAPKASTGLRGPGTHRVMLANVDSRLLLWVDGGVVEFDAPTAYGDVGNDRPEEADLTPVGIASRKAAVGVNHLRVFRDIYYIATKEIHAAMTDFDPVDQPYPRYFTDDSVGRFLSSPDVWDVFKRRREVDFPLEKGQYFVLGDNSAESKDSRLWGEEYYVSEDLLIGKAFFIYWPHSWNQVPYLGIPFPYFPNFARMGLVR